MQIPFVRTRKNRPFMATGSKSNKSVEEMVKNLGFDYRVIGDAQKPAKVLEAIWSGNVWAVKCVR